MGVWNDWHVGGCVHLGLDDARFLAIARCQVEGASVGVHISRCLDGAAGCCIFAERSSCTALVITNAESLEYAPVCRHRAVRFGWDGHVNPFPEITGA